VKPLQQQQTTAQKLTRAKVRILLEQPFFGTLALRLKLVPGCLPTMATDGSRIVYNAAFVDELKPAELEGTLAHEVLHCALGHHCRRGERDPELWNQAADFAINPILLGNGFTLPAGALVDPAFNNLSAEEIYARLLQRRGGGGAAPPKQDPQQTNAGEDWLTVHKKHTVLEGQIRRLTRPLSQLQTKWEGRGARAPTRDPWAPEGSGKSGTQLTTRVIRPRQPRNAASSTSGVSRRSRPFGRPRRADTSRQELKGR